MSRLTTGVLIWSLTRYTRNTNLWDRVCFQCKQTTPVFEYEHRGDQGRSLFHYLCEECAPKKLAAWLQSAAHTDAPFPRSQTDFDSAAVFYEQTSAWQKRYHQRAGIEGTHSQGIRVCNLRQARYRG